MNVVDDLINKYRNRGLLIDTNLLLLLIIGIFDKQFIGNYSRLNKYDDEDFEILKVFVGEFNKLIITPHILTELSNLSFFIKEPKLSEYIQILVKTLKAFHEETLNKDAILNLNLLPKLGVTDSTFIEVAKTKKYLLITDDFDAYINSQLLKIDAINFNHIRQFILNN